MLNHVSVFQWPTQYNKGQKITIATLLRLVDSGLKIIWK